MFSDILLIIGDKTARVVNLLPNIVRKIGVILMFQGLPVITLSYTGKKFR